MNSGQGQRWRTERSRHFAGLVVFVLAVAASFAGAASETGKGQDHDLEPSSEENLQRGDTFSRVAEGVKSPDSVTPVESAEEVLEWEVLWFDRKLNVLDFDDEEGVNHFLEKFDAHIPFQVLRHRTHHRRKPEQGLWPEGWPEVWPANQPLRQHASWAGFEAQLQHNVEAAAVTQRENEKLSQGNAESVPKQNNEDGESQKSGQQEKTHPKPSENEREASTEEDAAEGASVSIAVRADDMDPSTVEEMLLALQGRCFLHKEGYWHYEVCPFHNASQFHAPGDDPQKRAAENALGVFGSASVPRPPIQAPDGHIRPPVVTHRYTRGSECGERGHRELMVTWLCAAGAVGGEEALHRVDSLVETSICKYHITFHTSLLCRPPPPTAVVREADAPAYLPALSPESPSAQSVAPVPASLPSSSTDETAPDATSEAGAIEVVSGAEEGSAQDPQEWAAVGLEGDGKYPRTETVSAGPLALRSRLGLKVEHCFNLNASCSVTFWLWLKPSDSDGMPKVERAILTAKEKMHTVAPHLLWGFPQAPNQLFCGMHSVSENQMVGAFGVSPLATERWMHVAVVFHRNSRMECIVDGAVQTTVPVKAPLTLKPNPPAELQNMYLGGSARWHVSITGVMLDVRMHHHQALDLTTIRALMRTLPPEHNLYSSSSSSMLALAPATPASAAAAVAPRGVVRPTGNHSMGHWHHVEELLAGKDHSLLALGHRQLQGIGGLEPSCESAAIYYRAAADQAIQEIGSADAAAVEFVRLSDEVEKGNAFEGHYGEDDDVLKYQQQLADGGDARAQAWLGHRYYWGVGGVQRDRQRAVQYLDQAARQGHVEAQYNLGVMRAYGHGIEKDRAESIRLFREAADKGYVAAQNGLALSLTDGSPDNNFTEAFGYFNKSAQAGNADGLYNAALLLRDGRGVEKNEELAYRYMVMAVRQDHQTARLALGWMLMEGKGATKSCPDAVSYLKAAAERGRWGMLLRDGLDAYLAGDVGLALEKYEAAAELGYEVAQSNAAWLYTHHCPSATCQVTTRHAQMRARELLEGAAGNGQPAAMRLLGDSLWYGFAEEEGGEGERAGSSQAVELTGPDVGRDLARGLEYYKRGAGKGDIQSAFNVAVAYYRGEVVERNVTEARRWVREGLRAARRARGGTHLYPLLLLKWAMQAEGWLRAWWAGEGLEGTEEEEGDAAFGDELEEVWEAGTAEMMEGEEVWEMEVYVDLPDLSWIKDSLGASDATWEEFLSAEGLVLLPVLLYLAVTYGLPALQEALGGGRQRGEAARRRHEGEPEEEREGDYDGRGEAEREGEE